jgi:hypothetical protein
MTTIMATNYHHIQIHKRRRKKIIWKHLKHLHRWMPNQELQVTMKMCGLPPTASFSNFLI